MTVVPVEKIEKYLNQAFVAWGASEEIAQEVTAQLLEASLTGHDSHGVLRAPWYLEKIASGDLNPAGEVTIHNETPSSAIVDGGWGFGQPASRVAMDLCIEKAKNSVIACVTVRNANHMGRVGFYTQRASDAGMVGMGCVNLHGSSHCVAPFGGIDRRLPTNPFSIAYPSGRETGFLMDFTTSVVAEGKLQLRRNAGIDADPEWIIDHDGNPSVNPWDFYNEPKGALLPMGGVVSHKGFALSMAVDGLAGALAGAQCSNPNGTRHGNACWYVAINIEAFTSLESFENNIGDLIDHVKSSRQSPGVDKIYYPGEPEAIKRKKREVEGVEIDQKTWSWLEEMAGKKGIYWN